MNAVLNYKDEKLSDYGFGFTIDVSLDSNCGVFRRYHVENNPVNKKDPLGLMSCGSCDLNECLNSCAAGGEALADFCRSIPDPRLRAGCWALEFAGETVCNGWCFWNCR
jgi:hypothetical protein